MKKRDLLIILVSLSLICINAISFSKQDISLKAQVKTELAKAIIELEKDDMIKQNINQNSFPIEYNFSVNNYRENDINEVDFDYVIEIECSNNDFPISYSLLDCSNNKEIKLCDGKSEKLALTKNKKESRNFKVYLQWREIEGEMAENVRLKLKVNAVQGRNEEKNENS